MAYEPTKIPKTSAGVIKNISTSIATSSEATILQLSYLESAIQQYKEAIQRSIDLKLEHADLICKYKNMDTGGVYNLPGVFSQTVAATDLSVIRNDNQRLAVIKEEMERAEDEANLYYKMIVENYKDLVRQFSKISKGNVSLGIFFENLNNYSNWTNK